MTHFDVEEPGFEGIHLTGSFAEVVHNQVESSGRQEVRVRAAELLSPCGENRKRGTLHLTRFKKHTKTAET